MNKFRILNLVFLISILLFLSCSKQIEGTVVDNFNNPIKDVNVTIRNTDYAAQTNAKGEFSIDYAAGEFTIEFEAEGYIGRQEVLQITEKQTYPLKQKKLVKMPHQPGIYVGSPELGDYIELKSQSNIHYNTTQSASNGFFTKKSRHYYVENKDSLTVIKLDSLNKVLFYHYNIKNFLLGRLGEDMKVAELSVDIFTPRAKANQAIRGQKEKITNSIYVSGFNIEFDVDYVYVFENGISTSKTLPSVYLFRFEKK